jgi:hypothetical protein
MTRIKPNQPKLPLQDRLALEANRLKDKASKLPYGPLRDAVIRKARQVETASYLDQWLSSPGLRAPT